jgi:hypothetical protein
MTKLEVDIYGRALTERDKTLLDLLLRPGGASLESINRAMMAKAAYGDDSEGQPSVWAEPHGRVAKGAPEDLGYDFLPDETVRLVDQRPQAGRSRGCLGLGGFVIRPFQRGADRAKGKHNAGASGKL